MRGGRPAVLDPYADRLRFDARTQAFVRVTGPGRCGRTSDASVPDAL
jgi:hypothetical protein